MAETDTHHSLDQLTLLQLLFSAERASVLRSGNEASLFAVGSLPELLE